ncbi:hypothetical protein ASF04_00040 [Duganella sp. Leaf61]|uniref:hypothetical protein n=1 Tax=Duganella sp. Leaf61 TaxID=1736227 RepID=UPI0006F56F72|nr:hypothetical protein [Duganella sp. Leaf61]KQN78933.1 hypothetical protein ASF04_00040 [Duganella sp. Leaf61]
MITRRQLLAASAASASLAVAPAVPAAPDVLRFVFSRPLDNPRTQWLIRVYTQLTTELGLGFAFVEVPPKRATALVLLGEVDGELGRTFDYQLLYPTLVRVPEPNNAVRFSAYATRPSLRFDTWHALRAGGVRCEYRLGIVELERMLLRELPATQVSAIPTIAQGVKKLLLGRTDLYFDVEEAVGDYLFFSRSRSAPWHQHHAAGWRGPGHHRPRLPERVARGAGAPTGCRAGPPEAPRRCAAALARCPGRVQGQALTGESRYRP